MTAHQPGAEKIDIGAWRPTCSCGWRGKELPRKEAGALHIAEHHAAQKGCGKVRFKNRADAEDAVLQAKLSRGLHGNDKRREQRAYPCPECPGKVWHLTSRPARQPLDKGYSAAPDGRPKPPPPSGRGSPAVQS